MMVFDGENGNDFFFEREGPGAGWWWWSGCFLSGYIVISDNKHIVFFGYWTYFEYTKGQSIGKRVMRIKTTDLYGNKPSLKSVMLGSLVSPSFL